MLSRAARSLLNRGRLAPRVALRAISTKPDHYENDDETEFPREWEGNNYAVNWSLCCDGVPPEGNAFYDHRYEALHEFAKDGAELAKEPCKIREVDVDIEFNEFDDLREAVRLHLCNHDDIFVQDGMIGSYHKDTHRVRIISDCPLAALFAKNSFFHVTRKHVDDQEKSPIVVYIATKGSYADSPSDAVLCLEEDDGHFARVLLTGKVSLDTMRESIAKAAHLLSNACEKSSSLIVKCDSLVSEGKSALVFNASDRSRAAGVKSGVLFGGHHNIWNEDGLGSFWGGVTIPDGEYETKQPKFAANGLATIKRTSNNLTCHPSAAIFVGSEAGIKELALNEAVNLFMSNEPNEDSVAKFESLMKNNNTKAFTVGNEGDIVKALSQS